MVDREEKRPTSETKAERDATAESARGRRLSATKRVLRDSLIVQRKAQAWPLEAIAREADITERQVRRVLEERRTMAVRLIEQDPVDVLHDLVAAFQASIADFEVMGNAYADTHPSAAVGAKKAAAQGRERLVALLQVAGGLPRDIGEVGDLKGLRELATAMVDVVRDFEAGRVDAEEVVAVFERGIGIGRPRSGLSHPAT